MLRRRILFFVVLLLLPGTVTAQTDKTDDFIAAEMKRQNIPGLSLAVVKDGKVIKAEGYGVADIKEKTPARPETVYKIASVSKQFIATGIMLLAQERRLGLDDPIGRYLEGTPATWNGITIRHLLTHTSGILREAPGFDPFKIQSDADVIKTAFPLPLRFAPGEKWEYGNTSYFALAEIIRKVAGRPWSEYLTEKVFKPAGMNTTFTTDTKERVPNLAKGYADNNKLLEAANWRALRPSGAFLSTVLDLAKWDAVLNTGRILGESTRREMWTPVKLNNGDTYPYGFGWQLGNGARRLVHHGGGMPGFASEFARYVDDGLTVIILMNLDDVDPLAILQGVAELHLPESTPSRAR